MVVKPETIMCTYSRRNVNCAKIFSLCISKDSSALLHVNEDKIRMVYRRVEIMFSLFAFIVYFSFFLS